jgi:hypothetical protein
VEHAYGQKVSGIDVNLTTLDMSFNLTGGCRIDLMNLASAGSQDCMASFAIEREVWVLDAGGPMLTRCYLPHAKKPGTLDENGLPPAE